MALGLSALLCSYSKQSIALGRRNKVIMYQTKFIFKPFLILIDIIGYVFFFWLKFRRVPEPKKILCIRIDHIGDVLLTTPAFRALRKKYPKARIDVLVRSFSKEILDGNKNINKILTFDFPWLGLHGKKASWKETISFIKHLRKEKYDIAVDFHADPRNILLAAKAARYRVGYGIRGFGFLLNKVVPYKTARHQIQHNLDIVRALGANASQEMDFIIPASAKNKAKSLLKPAGNAKLVGITPATGRKPKYWLNERWAEVADKLIEKYRVKVVLTGGKGDAKDIEEIISNMVHKENIINLSGKTSLKELGAVIRQCKLFLSPDTGPAHIARALNVPLLELFGPENPKQWGYNEPKFRHIKRKEMKEITPEDVLSAVKQMGILD
jgi:ADP-heptose:LPS heptosyltransferase